MEADLKDILSNSNKDIDNQKLMDYLSNKLSQEDRHEFEKQMADSEFVNDAVEGLEAMQDKNSAMHLAEKLNADLHKQLSKKKTKRNKLKLKDQPWVYYAVILILFLLIVSYLLIRKHLGD
ncbi:hypothetical protein BH09BAC2_BH09BAC2_17200 [soil metagenome]